MNVLVVHVAAVTHATDTDGAIETCGEGERTSVTRGLTEGLLESENVFSQPSVCQLKYQID